MMLETCTLAVLALMNRARAISGLDRPAASSASTSRSRSVSPNRASSSAGTAASQLSSVAAISGRSHGSQMVGTAWIGCWRLGPFVQLQPPARQLGTDHKLPQRCRTFIDGQDDQAGKGTMSRVRGYTAAG